MENHTVTKHKCEFEKKIQKKETREEGNPIDKKNNTWRKDENVIVTLVLHD